MQTARAWARALDDTCRGLARHDDDPRRCGTGARRAAGRARLVCDLTGVGFLGASGLTVLVETATLAVGVGPVLRPLRLTGLDRALCVDAHLATAITHALRGR